MARSNAPFIPDPLDEAEPLPDEFVEDDYLDFTKDLVDLMREEDDEEDEYDDDDDWDDDDEDDESDDDEGDEDDDIEGDE